MENLQNKFRCMSDMEKKLLKKLRDLKILLPNESWKLCEDMTSTSFSYLNLKDKHTLIKTCFFFYKGKLIFYLIIYNIFFTIINSYN